MKNNTSLIYNILLVIGDFLALVGAFSVAYILRVSISHVRISTPIKSETYLQTFLILLPFFILLFALIGLYSKEIYENRFKEFGRLIVGSFIGILFVISYGYVFNIPIFPARLVIVYGFALALIFTVLFRNLARYGRKLLFKYHKGLNNVLLVGDTDMSQELMRILSPSDETGYCVIGVVGGIKKPLKQSADYALFADFDQAINKIGPRLHTIIQTALYGDAAKNSKILTYAQENHISYQFVPGNSELFVGNLSVEIFKGIPVVDVRQTAIIGWGRVVKRTLDIVLGSLLLIIASPFMLIIALVVKLSDGHGPVFFRQTRLTRYNQKFDVYKFRTNKIEFNGLTPEAAFTKLGRPELIKAYRDNGDFIEHDPRITSIGRFLRRTSLDELPQLINVLKGDLSLVGPRALIPQELAAYTKRHTILSVRSGLTGLAQVSGRRDISFDERRQLDLYYVQNWSFWLDLIILAKTVWTVLSHKGAA